MIIETSTVNVLLGTILGLQAWLLIEIVNLKTNIAALKEHCRICKKHEDEHA